MQITAEPREGYTVLHLRGEFDTFYCPLFLREVEELAAGGARHVVLNMRLVKFINSTALGAIIKASKTLGGGGGTLAISRPSPFVREIMEKVGLDRVVPIFDTDEAAGSHVRRAHATAAAPADESVLDDETALLFAPVDARRVEHFVPESARSQPRNPVHGHAFGSSWRGVGRMSGLDAEGLRFTWNGGSTGLTPFEMGQMLSLGTDLRVKFRLPLLRKGHCEAVVTVTDVEERPDGVKIGSTFSEIDGETRDAVQQYAEDLAFLKSELHRATED